MANELQIQPVATEVRVVGREVERISTYPRTEVRIIQSASPAAGAGGGGLSGYEHIQGPALMEWIVNHNMGRYPIATSVLSIGQQEVGAEVQHVSVNQTRVRFASPYSGIVRII